MDRLSCGHVPVSSTRACPECPRPDGWKDDSPCAGHHDPELWFADGIHRGPKRTRTVYEALALCAPCQVRPYCLEAGWHETNGIWGGWTSDARRDYQAQHPHPQRPVLRALAIRPRAT